MEGVAGGVDVDNGGSVSRNNGVRVTNRHLSLHGGGGTVRGTDKLSKPEMEMRRVAEHDFSLRHLAFFQELAGMEESDVEWRAVSAGLVALRLVDRWADEGAEVLRGDAWGVRAVRSAIEEVEGNAVVRTILTSVVDAVEGKSAEMSLVAPRLMAYGRALDYEGKFRLAADVYETLVAYSRPLEEPDLAIDANMRLAYCERMSGDLDRAAAAYARASEIAEGANDVAGVLRARIGDAKIAIARGNLPRAEEILAETADRAAEHSLTEMRALALHEQAAVAHLRKDNERAIRLAFAALQNMSNPVSRDRALGDIASAFAELGVRSVARDAHLLLAATAQEQSQKWIATINLMEIAALDQCEPVFEQYRRELAVASLPPELAAAYELYVGKGYQAFGKLDLAVESLEQARILAERHRLNQLAFEAEQQIELVRNQGRGSVPQGVGAPEAVQDVADAIGRMREMAGLVA